MTEPPYVWPKQDQDEGNEEAQSAVAIRVRDDTVCINAAAFRDFVRLQQVHLPESLQMIGLEAFQNCVLLSEINFPSSIIQIQDQAFAGCVSLTQAIFVNGLQLLGSEAFEGCVRLTTVVLPSTLEFLGTTVFAQCYKLSSVTFLCEKLEVIPEEAFDNCSALRHVKLPKSIKVIEQSAFNNCLCLASIELPLGLEEIGARAFCNCCTMVSLELPEGLEEMEELALSSCNSLKNLRLLQPDYFGINSQNDDDDDREDVSDDEDGSSLQNWDRLLEIFPNQSVTQRALYKRFDDLPLHKLCYHQIHYDSENEVMEAFDSIQAIEEMSATGTSPDALGMTPLHILALSAKPHCQLFSAILEKYPLELILKKDSWGKSCLNYLFINKTPNPRPDLLELGAKLNQAGHIKFPKRRQAIHELLAQDLESNPIKHRKRLVAIFYQLAICQKLENLCTLELALWKSALFVDSPKRIKRDRQEVRISCGADIVISNALPFMDEINK